MRKLNAVLVGFGSILSIFPTLDAPKPKTPDQIEKEVWKGVGDSLRFAIRKHEKRQQQR